MTDTEAIADVDAMATETENVKAEVEGAHTEASTAMANLRDSLDNYNSSASQIKSGLAYVLSHYGS